MNEWLLLLGTLVLGYLLGAIPFGYLVARWRGVDIFAHGSGNIGATNVGRVLGRKFGIAVFVLDFLKGALPTFAAVWGDRNLDTAFSASTLPVAMGLATFLGHLFPIYLGFKGGKGVATGAGVVMVLVPVPALLAILAWTVLACSTLYVSVASLGSVLVLCVHRLTFTADPLAPDHRVLTSFCLVASLLVWIRHIPNIRRLIHGKENHLRENTFMAFLARFLHVLALSLWFGSAIFFTFVVGFALFGQMESLARLPASERPLWFPLPSAFAREIPDVNFAQPKEQGTRAAGYAIGPMFDQYFLIQCACALIALTTSLRWSGQGRLHRARTWILVAALLLVAVGWWLEYRVSELRIPRNERTEAVLLAAEPTSALIEQANEARKTFGMWHGISVLINLLTIVLVTGALALVPCVPADIERQSSGAAP